MNLRVLLIESEAEELLFLQDVLREIEQERLLPEWPRIESYYAATWAEAERILSTSAPHAILLDVEMEQASQQPTETFRLVQAAAPDVPVILLVDPREESLATRLMRDGAQDFLFKSQVDCAPVAHTLRNAVLRQRLLCGARAASLTDSLTDLPNRASFLAIAARDHKLATQLNRRWILLVAEPKNLPQLSLAFGDHRLDLILAQAADRLRGIATPADLVARIGDRFFGLSIFESELESAEETCARIRTAAAEHDINVGVSIFPQRDPGRLGSLPSLDTMLALALANLPQQQPAQLVGRAAGTA
jgi:two-component system cell cycle response regulator